MIDLLLLTTCSVWQPDLVCSNHHKALTWLNAEKGQLFSVRNGIFGTMPVGLTGVTDYERGYPRWQQRANQLTVPGQYFLTFTISIYHNNKISLFEKCVPIKIVSTWIIRHIMLTSFFNFFRCKRDRSIALWNDRDRMEKHRPSAEQNMLRMSLFSTGRRLRL